MKAVDFLTNLFAEPAPKETPASPAAFDALLAEANDQQAALLSEGMLPDDASAALLAGTTPGALADATLSPDGRVVPRLGTGKLLAARSQVAMDARALLATPQGEPLPATPLGTAGVHAVSLAALREEGALEVGSVVHADAVSPDEALANEALLGQVAAQIASLVAPAPQRAATPATPSDHGKHAVATAALTSATDTVEPRRVPQAADFATLGQPMLGAYAQNNAYARAMQTAMSTQQAPSSVAQTTPGLPAQQLVAPVASGAPAVPTVTGTASSQGAAQTPVLGGAQPGPNAGTVPVAQSSSRIAPVPHAEPTVPTPLAAPPSATVSGAGPGATQLPVDRPAQGTSPQAAQAVPQAAAPSLPQAGASSVPQGARPAPRVEAGMPAQPAPAAASAQPTQPQPTMAVPSAAPQTAPAPGAEGQGQPPRVAAVAAHPQVARSVAELAPELTHAPQPQPMALPRTPVPRESSPAVTPQTAMPQTVTSQTVMSQTAMPQTAMPQNAMPQTVMSQTAMPQTAMPQTALPPAAPPPAAPPPAAPPTVTPQAAPLQTQTPPTATPQSTAPQPVAPTLAAPTHASAGAPSPGWAAQERGPAVPRAVWPAAPSPAADPRGTSVTGLQTNGPVQTSLQTAGAPTAPVAAQLGALQVSAESTASGRGRGLKGQLRDADAAQLGTSAPTTAVAPLAPMQTPPPGIAPLVPPKGAPAARLEFAQEGPAFAAGSIEDAQSASGAHAQGAATRGEGRPQLTARRTAQGAAMPTTPASSPFAQPALPPVATESSETDAALSVQAGAQPALPVAHVPTQVIPPPVPIAPPPVPVAQPLSGQALEGGMIEAAQQQLAESEAAAQARSERVTKASDDNMERLSAFSRGAAIGSTLSAYGGRGHAGADHRGDRESRTDSRREEGDVAQGSQSLEATARAFEQASVQLQQPPGELQPAAPFARPVAPMSSPVPLPELPDVEFARAPVQPENASISLHHPDLGPIQLQVHRNQGRVEVHALIDSAHAEAVLRANESGIRYGVQQSGMALGALRVRMREGGEERELPSTRGSLLKKRRVTNERQA